MAYHCLNHPERDAIGICVKCRKYVCVECATKIEGVNYCADCLPRAHRREGKRTRSWERPAAAVVTLASLLVCSLCIGGFAVFGIPQARSDVPEERWEENDEWMETIVGALLEFREDCGRFPAADEGLQVLMLDYYGEISGWDGPYLDSPMAREWGEVEDVYGTPIRYWSDGLETPVIVSAGADGEFEDETDTLTSDEGDSGDDVVFWVR